MNALASFDTALTRYIKRWPAWLQPIMITVSFIGGPLVVIGSALTATIAAYSLRQNRMALGFLAALAAFGLSSGLKRFLHRTRPDTLYVTTMRFKSYSFPSGHSFGTSLIYGLLIDLARLQVDRPWSYIIIMVGTVIIALVGLSRIYLGAHFPTDVLGAWLFSLAFLALIIKLFFNHG